MAPALLCQTFQISRTSPARVIGSNGLGMTLLPEMSIKLECRRSDIHLMRFAEPQPNRVIGLAWRRSSPRSHHFIEFGSLIAAVMAEQMREAQAA